MGEFQDAIPILQHIQKDPKHRIPASIYLGRAFLSAGFADEAVDTLKAVIDEYPGRGDERSIQMFYWYARALEEKKDNDPAIKAYSQVAQWNLTTATCKCASNGCAVRQRESFLTRFLSRNGRCVPMCGRAQASPGFQRLAG